MCVYTKQCLSPKELYKRQTLAPASHIPRPPHPDNTMTPTGETPKTFASVAWLSQSSRIPDSERLSRMDPRVAQLIMDSPTLVNSWSTVPFHQGNIQMHPHQENPGNEQMAKYPRSAVLAPFQRSKQPSPGPQNIQAHQRSNYMEVSYATDNETSSMDNYKLSMPVYEPISPAMDDTNTPRSALSPALPSKSQEDQADTQTNSSEDMAHSVSFLDTACSSNADSGYESETSRSTSPDQDRESIDASDEEGKVGRRLRTAFTCEQISTLEKTFKKHRYLGASERRKLATKLQLSEIQIKTWFQNRRMKYKREIQDSRPDAFHSAHMFGVYGYPPQHQSNAYHYTHPVQCGPQPMTYSHPTLVDNMPGSLSYSLPSPTLNPINPFKTPSLPMMYLPQQSVMHTTGYHDERQFVRY
ncbi:homeobox protein XHOX-3-like [Spea bombifrons]|uniref:homeobox protein XHOX-3-like n=1 Tax=Spea bombifrons TaxID=233779 RepID=UPI00234AFDF5|nr:homeobox protein XHOX-3-like [Spea bombifrons]